MNYSSMFLLKEFDPAPEFSGRTVSSVRNVCMMPGGEIGLLATLSAGSLAEPQPFALYAGQPGELRPWLRSDEQNIPGYPPGARFLSLEKMQPVGIDKFGVLAEVLVSVGDVERSLFLVSATSIQLLWRKGQPALCPALAATRHFIFDFASSVTSSNIVVHEAVTAPFTTQDNDEFIEFGTEGVDHFAWREGMPFPNQVTPVSLNGPFAAPALCGDGVAFQFTGSTTNLLGIARADVSGAICLASPHSAPAGYPGLTTMQVRNGAGASSDGHVLYFCDVQPHLSAGSVGLLIEHTQDLRARVVGMVGEAAPGLAPTDMVERFNKGVYSNGMMILEVQINNQGRVALYRGTPPFSSMQLLWDSNMPAIWRPDQAMGKIDTWAVGPRAQVIVSLSFGPSQEQAILMLAPNEEPVLVVKSGDIVDGDDVDSFMPGNTPGWGLEGGHGSPCIANNGDYVYQGMIPYTAGRRWALLLAKAQP